MAEPHRPRKDNIPDYDGSYDPVDLGAAKDPGHQKQKPQRREVTVRRKQPVPQRPPQDRPTPRKPAPQPQRPPAGQEPEERESRYLVLFGVGAGVMVLCLLALGILLLRTSSGGAGESSVITLETLPETAPVTEMPVTETEPPTTEPPQTEPPTTEPPETEPTETETQRPRTWDVLYEELLSAEMAAWGSRYDLVDVDGNGTPELFISDGDFMDAAVRIYTVQGESALQVTQVKTEDGSVTVVPDAHEILWTSETWPSVFHVYLLDGTAFTPQEELTYQSEVGSSFTRNGEDVSIYEFSRAYDRYVSQRSVQNVGRAFNFDDIGDLPDKAASRTASQPVFEDPWWQDYLVEPEPTTEPPTKPHSFWDNWNDLIPGIQDYF
ncbi:MAG: hypothetical protein K5695_08295 [Oscillospiraceae bacterium]|nr:hypothetical protein [Oscillospiraceae bacterium]